MRPSATIANSDDTADRRTLNKSTVPSTTALGSRIRQNSGSESLVKSRSLATPATTKTKLSAVVLVSSRVTHIFKILFAESCGLQCELSSLFVDYDNVAVLNPNQSESGIVSSG